MTNSSFKLLTSSETNEHYTPHDIINATKEVIGEIDLDPASNLIAQQWIGATKFYTKEDDGMSKNWEGRVWLNPPYGKKSKDNYGAGKWFEKLHESYISGSVIEAIALGRGDSIGLKLLTKNYVWCDCDRISFLDEKGNIQSNPVPGSRIFYLGMRNTQFAKVFKQFGTILVNFTERG